MISQVVQNFSYLALTVPTALLLRVSVQKLFRRAYKKYQNA